MEYDYTDGSIPIQTLNDIVDFLQAKVFLNTCSKLFNRDLHSHVNLLAGSPIFKGEVG